MKTAIRIFEITSSLDSYSGGEEEGSIDAPVKNIFFPAFLRLTSPFIIFPPTFLYKVLSLAYFG